MTNADLCRQTRLRRKMFLKKDRVKGSPILQLSMDGEVISVHKTVTLAALAVGGTWANKKYSNILHCLNGRQDSAYGYRWLESDKHVWLQYGVKAVWKSLKDLKLRRRAKPCKQHVARKTKRGRVIRAISATLQSAVNIKDRMSRTQRRRLHKWKFDRVYRNHRVARRYLVAIGVLKHSEGLRLELTAGWRSRMLLSLQSGALSNSDLAQGSTDLLLRLSKTEHPHTKVSHNI